jgi:hypothetical protein
MLAITVTLKSAPTITMIKGLQPLVLAIQCSVMYCRVVNLSAGMGFGVEPIFACVLGGIIRDINLKNYIFN